MPGTVVPNDQLGGAGSTEPNRPPENITINVYGSDADPAAIARELLWARKTQS